MTRICCPNAHGNEVGGVIDECLGHLSGRWQSGERMQKKEQVWGVGMVEKMILF